MCCESYVLHLLSMLCCSDELKYAIRHGFFVVTRICGFDKFYYHNWYILNSHFVSHRKIHPNGFTKKKKNTPKCN